MRKGRDDTRVGRAFQAAYAPQLSFIFIRRRIFHRAENRVQIVV